MGLITGEILAALFLGDLRRVRGACGERSGRPSRQPEDEASGGEDVTEVWTGMKEEDVPWVS